MIGTVLKTKTTHFSSIGSNSQFSYNFFQSKPPMSHLSRVRSKVYRLEKTSTFIAHKKLEKKFYHPLCADWQYIHVCTPGLFRFRFPSLRDFFFFPRPLMHRAFVAAYFVCFWAAAAVDNSLNNPGSLKSTSLGPASPG